MKTGKKEQKVNRQKQQRISWKEYLLLISSLVPPPKVFTQRFLLTLFLYKNPFPSWPLSKALFQNRPFAHQYISETITQASYSHPETDWFFIENVQSVLLFDYRWTVTLPWRMAESGFIESMHRSFQRHRDHKTQTTEKGKFGFYSRLISRLVPWPNVRHSDSCTLSRCIKTFSLKGNRALGQAAEA